MPVDRAGGITWKFKNVLLGVERQTGNNAVKLCVQTILTSQRADTYYGTTLMAGYTMARILTILTVSMLCLCVTMQVLGAPITLWAPQLSVDVLGASIPPSPPMIHTSLTNTCLPGRGDTLRSPLLARNAFHPPCRLLAFPN